MGQYGRASDKGRKDRLDQVYKTCNVKNDRRLMTQILLLFIHSFREKRKRERRRCRKKDDEAERKGGKKRKKRKEKCHYK